MSDQNLVLSDQESVLAGHMSFQKEKIICSPVSVTEITDFPSYRKGFGELNSVSDHIHLN